MTADTIAIPDSLVRSIGRVEERVEFLCEQQQEDMEFRRTILERISDIELWKVRVQTTMDNLGTLGKMLIGMAFGITASVLGRLVYLWLTQ